MFDFVFGGKQKLELIRELLEQRMRGIGFDDMDSKLKIKQMSNFQLIGTPEGTLVSIIEIFVKLQKSGMLIWQVIDKLENQRQRIGHNADDFNSIMNIARNPNKAGEAVPMYCSYRLDLEYPMQEISDEEFANAFSQTTDFLMQKYF